MLAVDTNVLVRIFVNDHPQQSKLALRLLAEESVFVSKTVLLETEWVLRCMYDAKKPAILRAIQLLLTLSNVTIENHLEVMHAVEMYGRGIDFSDALHLATSRRAKSFVTFDRKMIKNAKKLVAAIPVVNLENL